MDLRFSRLVAVLVCALCGLCVAPAMAQVCGDGVVDAGEACDDGVNNSDVTADACRTDCTIASCGDGVVDAGEACDDGVNNSDVTADACRTDCTIASCGDGVVDAGESCDDGVNNADDTPGACRTDCTGAGCGDGVIDAGEACDDGVNNSDDIADACRTDCTIANCGDGVVDAGESCDAGALNGSGAGVCATDCSGLQTCGDSVVDGTEECDEGGETATCDDDCTVVECGDLNINEAAGEECEGTFIEATGIRCSECRLTCETPGAGSRLLLTKVPGVSVCRLLTPNLLVAAVLQRLDIDGDGVADFSPDTDGDGLPDNWELGGNEPDGIDRVVFFPAPSPVVPGTPPTPIFIRRPVATSALLADTDGDGISDFIEVFGLLFIDDNGNGILDPQEWAETENAADGLFRNGLPNPGEFPIDQSRDIEDFGGVGLQHDFDGFVWTDPTNPDTDGDAILDGRDRDPLINPRSFGISENIIVRFNAEGNDDIDGDGLGNGMDMGNDLVTQDGVDVPRDFQVIDNPANLLQLLALFRSDLLAEGVVPESAIEDLLGADWDGSGLWRTTDVREWTPLIDLDERTLRPPDEFFILDGERLYRPQSLADLQAAELNDYGVRGIGLGWQEALRPVAKTQFIPDLRIWAILYAWRVPGFDIDGDGFTGVPNITAARADRNGERLVLQLTGTTGAGSLVSSADIESPTIRPFDDRIRIGQEEPRDPSFDGAIDVPGLSPLGDALRAFGCGGVSATILATMFLGLTVPRLRRRRK